MGKSTFPGRQLSREDNFPGKSNLPGNHLSWGVTCRNLRHKATNDEGETTDRVKCPHRPESFAAGKNEVYKVYSRALGLKQRNVEPRHMAMATCLKDESPRRKTSACKASFLRAHTSKSN